MNNWQEAIVKEFKARQALQLANSAEFPLMENCFNEDEILAGVEVMLSGQLTMAKNVVDFEQDFCRRTGSPFAVMVNSGSSANLLAVAVAMNPLRKGYLKTGDEILLPAVCWSTSLWPLVQFGLKPVFVDVNPRTLNMDLSDAAKKITSKTRGVFTVHILGNSPDMGALQKFVSEHGLIHIEDTCESLGSTHNGKFLGNVGDMGCYSFYYSHHLTTGEGGMVTCKTQEDADLLRCLRAHGWTRNLSNRQEIENKHSEIDSRFLFVNSGFNLRPTDVAAAIGIVQLKKMGTMNSNRVKNYENLRLALTNHPHWRGQLEFIEPTPGTKPVWFGFCALLNQKFASDKKEYLSELSKCGIENRPIVSGNFVRQPALKLYGLEQNPEDFPGAEEIDKRGFFIGLHTTPLNAEKILRLADLLLKPLS
ncbi:MAG: DegT/DnrJ/EryC1/StrS family aminotransferase [Bdellovibrionales bacterium]|nr:DegT/DnrJ/EryC1/StrS family aminotransferase [Bdellovibrionales bacterium]